MTASDQGGLDTRAGIYRAIVDNIVDKALFQTIDKHASLSAK